MKGAQAQMALEKLSLEAKKGKVMNSLEETNPVDAWAAQ